MARRRTRPWGLRYTFRMIDLRSDTLTKPTPEMRAAMAAAEVGDDVYGEDPTVNTLQERAAEITGKEAALFVPSGTMANLIAFMLHTRPGDTVVLAEESHPFHYEGANLARVGGLLAMPVPDRLGKLRAEEVARRVVQIDDPHFSHTTLVSIENTTNRGGGACYTPEEVRAVAEAAHASGMKLHCDGARIFNAALALGVEVRELTAPCDTVSFCLSKGLGAPVGSLLCMPRARMREALRLRKMLGGGMRQAGILAAAGLHALDHHVTDLARDHARAQRFRAAMEEQGFRFMLPSPTNILYLRQSEPYMATGALAGEGVLVLPHEPDAIRLVFHRDIDDAATGRAIQIAQQVLTP
jgi:threonine aldolase